MRRSLEWGALGAAIVAGGFVGDRVGVPSSYMFAAILAGLVVALRAPGRLVFPPSAFRGALAVTGATLGTYLQASTFTEIGARWAPVAVVSLATLFVSVAVGLLVARFAPVDRTTATLGMVAGGAAGIIGMSGELGADDRLVAFMQYMRVLLIVLFTPLLVAAFHGHGVQAEAAGQALLGEPEDWALTAVVATIGALIGFRTRLPAGVMLGPLLLAAVLSMLDLSESFSVPPLLRETAFALIGLQVGLRFERDTLRRIAGLALPMVAAVVSLVAACFGLAWVLTLWTGVPLLDAYLATTPGGLYAVLAIAFGSGADTTFVLAVQVLRLLVMIVLAPAVVRLLIRPRGPLRSRDRSPPAGSARR
jgi:membrane AbrB-like protein